MRTMDCACAREGIRATRPSKYWHIDVTVLRLISGPRIRLQAVIDNFSRKILAWRVMPRSEPRITRELLLEAAEFLALGAEPPTVVADSGVEDVNAEVDGLVETNVSGASWLR